MKTPKYTILTRSDRDSTWLVAFAGNSRAKAEQVLKREWARGRDDAFVAVRANKENV